MPEKNKNNQDQKAASKKPIKDLEARKDDASKVKGGRGALYSADPCEGGQ